MLCFVLIAGRNFRVQTNVFDGDLNHRVLYCIHSSELTFKQEYSKFGHFGKVCQGTFPQTVVINVQFWIKICKKLKSNN